MPDEKDQEQDVSSASSSTEQVGTGEAASQVEDDGAERSRGTDNKDAIIQRLKRQRDRDRERLTELEAQFSRSQTQPSLGHQAPQQPQGFDWSQPEQSIDRLVAQKVAQATLQTRNSLRTESQVDKAREYMQSQKGYNEEELRQVFEDDPDLADYARTQPLKAVKLAVKEWRISRGDTSSFDKRAAAGGVLPTAPPQRPRGHAELFERVKRSGPEMTDDDESKVWDELRRAEKQGAKIAF